MCLLFKKKKKKSREFIYPVSSLDDPSYLRAMEKTRMGVDYEPKENKETWFNEDSSMTP